ncbi:MAG: type IX secretion system membrane protein PorP/SprF [Cytophagaceae bacterium]|nr:type IX secretion system membrane protein PorP/SprF [Cytophagaceae bacterium]
MKENKAPFSNNNFFRVLVIVSLICVHHFGWSQQKAQFTQYMINPFLLNPAVAGTEDYTDLRAGYRYQWAGFEGAPRTLYVSGHTNLGKKKVVGNRTRHKKNGFHGLGFLLINDAIGASTSSAITGSYAYHVSLTKKMFVSMGANGGIHFYELDANKLRTANPDDPSITGFRGSNLADINIGSWLYSDKFYAGISMNQVFNPTLAAPNSEATSKGKMAHHYYLTGGYRIPFSYDWNFVPSILIKAVSPAPLSFDLNSKFRYKDLAWFGASYRNRDALAIMAGIVISNLIDISYSYDFTTSNIRQYSQGSHEVVLGWRLRSKQQVLCPSHFW